LRLFTQFRAVFAALLLLAASPALAKPQPALTAGAVASPDRYGALAAQRILKAGGNAVDAAVATAFTLAVTYPEAGNLGGGGFMTLQVDGKPYFLDYRETAPAGAKADMYLGPDGEPVAALSLFGNLAVGTPGTVRGMAMAHKRFGKLPWATVLAPAIGYARDGFLVTPQLIEILDGSRAPFRPPILRRTSAGSKPARCFASRPWPTP
jgi:gamma-glutamyltranspeptidase/glutathione hydrolase